MKVTSLRQRVGTLLLDRPRLAWVLGLPRLARLLGYSWVDFHNRDETLVSTPAGRGYDCRWRWTSDLNLNGAFPTLGARLLRLALAEWPIRLANSLDEPSSAGPLVSFVIGHRGTDKVPHLLATLRSILAQHGARVECIVVEQAQQPVLSGCLPERVRHVHSPPPSAQMPYARAWAFNLGARVAHGDILIFHDNDILVPTRYAEQVVATIQGGAAVARLQRFVFYLTEEQTNQILQTGIVPPPGAPACVRQNCEGHTLAVARDTYFALGGHDESFVGWGGEDNEMFDRCRAVECYPYGYLPFLHLHHPPQPRPADPERFTRRLNERLAIPAKQRIAELACRSFGMTTGPVLPNTI